MLARAIGASGLAGLIDEVVSVDGIRRYKPLPAAYALLSPWSGSEHHLTFYSSNRWDVAGAVARGIDSVWVNRRRHPDEYIGLRPRAVAADLGTAIAA
jgi:2-haloacid dehalogenase